MLDRRQILIALAQANQLTHARQRLVRAAPPHVLRAALVGWTDHAGVLEAAGIPSFAPHSRTAPDADTLQQIIDTHLALLNLPTAPAAYPPARVARTASLAPAWCAALRHDSRPLAESLHTAVLDPTLIFIIGHRPEPIWEPLVQLIEADVFPYGLHYTQQFFMLRDGR